MRKRVTFPKQDKFRFVLRPFCAGLLPHHLHIWTDCLIKQVRACSAFNSRCACASARITRKPFSLGHRIHTRCVGDCYIMSMCDNKNYHHNQELQAMELINLQIGLQNRIRLVFSPRICILMQQKFLPRTFPLEF